MKADLDCVDGQSKAVLRFLFFIWDMGRDEGIFGENTLLLVSRDERDNKAYDDDGNLVGDDGMSCSDVKLLSKGGREREASVSKSLDSNRQLTGEGDRGRGKRDNLPGGEGEGDMDQDAQDAEKLDSETADRAERGCGHAGRLGILKTGIREIHEGEMDWLLYGTEKSGHRIGILEVD